MGYRIVKGDVVKVTSSLFVDDYFDACLCDPPYLLQFMGKEFDKQHLKMRGANQGQKMQAWHEKWTREVLRVMKPGAHMLAFGGTRTYHRLASAAEDTGFEIRDMLAWMHGQGFPKGKTQLKPAQEPILLAAKPGKHYLSLDACRIAGAVPKTTQGGQGKGFSPEGKQESNPHVGGRWPANLVLSHHPDCIETDCTRTIKGTPSGYNFDRSVSGNPSKIATNIKSGIHYGNETVKVWECHPDCPVRVLDEQSADGGGASRFFYCAKVSRRERNLGRIDCRHPTLKPIALTTYLARLLLPPPHLKPKPVPRRLLIPFSGAGSEIIGALFAGWDEVWGIEQNPEYIADAEARIAARHTLESSLRV